MHAVRALFAALFVPALAGGLVIYILQSAAAQNGLTLSDLTNVCTPGGFALSLHAECAALTLHYHFLLLCAATAAAGVLVIAAFALASVITGSNRVMLSFVFPALSFVGLILVSAIVTAQIAILAGAIYFAEQFWLDRVHTSVVLVLAGIGALLGLSILWRSIRMFQPTVSGIIGAPLSAIEQPRLALLVQQIARAAGARNPDNIVLGLDTNFFATNAPIRTPTSPRLLTGQTLYLSLPLMRVMSLDEMKAVVGHELAHFSGADTTYSRHFAPIYRGLAEASHVAGENKQYDKNPLLLPARLFLRFMTDCFARNAARASRKRELRADQLGAQASTPTDLAYALIKSGILSILWRDELEDTVRDIQRGRFRRNMSRSFEDKLKFDVDPSKLPPLVAFSLGEHTPHPTDSHPTTDERITALGLNPAELSGEQRVMERFFASKPARTALDNMENVEEILTQVYHHLLIDPRQRNEEVERNDNEIFVVFLTSFLAHMVVADGLVDDREIETAEREAIERVQGFDQREFRDFCRHPQNMTPLEKLAEWSTKFLSPTGFEMLLDLLTKIAEADGEMHERERRIIETVRGIYNDVLASEEAGKAA
jgi:Zn-dependent protease with chaperone function/uncharacterized tellurite resistance protein B-like protein